MNKCLLASKAFIYFENSGRTNTVLHILLLYKKNCIENKAYNSFVEPLPNNDRGMHIQTQKAPLFRFSEIKGYTQTGGYTEK
jgi:protein-tyrosine phosphatase